MYEVTGLGDCSREIEVRFWWKKRLRRVCGAKDVKEIGPSTICGERIETPCFDLSY
jgi:hypothetical protein